MASAATVRGFTIVNSSSAAATAFLVWDTLLTLDDEVNLIWSKPNSSRLKWLYLFVRHLGVVFQLSLIFVGTDVAARMHYSPHACKIWYIYQSAATQALIAGVELILIFRVRALYLHNTIITRTLYSLFLIENACMAASLVFATRDAAVDSTCLATRTPFGLVYFAISFGTFEALLFALTLVKFFTALYAGWGNVPILTLLVRDGTWAFALIFVALCINAGFFLGAPDGMVTAAYQWMLVAESFSGARLILNMLAYEAPRDGEEDRVYAATPIRFASTVHLGPSEYLDGGASAGEYGIQRLLQRASTRSRLSKIWSLHSHSSRLDGEIELRDANAFDMAVGSRDSTRA